MNNIILDKVRKMLIEDGIVSVSGIITVEDIVTGVIDTVTIDRRYVPFIKEGNFSDKKLVKDFEEYFNTSLNLTGSNKLKVKLL